MTTAHRQKLEEDRKRAARKLPKIGTFHGPQHFEPEFWQMPVHVCEAIAAIREKLIDEMVAKFDTRKQAYTELAQEYKSRGERVSESHAMHDAGHMQEVIDLLNEER